MVEHGFIGAQTTTLPKPITPNIRHLIDSLEIASSDWSRQMSTLEENPVEYAPVEKELEQAFADLKGAKSALFRTVASPALLRNEWWLSPSDVERMRQPLGVSERQTAGSL